METQDTITATLAERGARYGDFTEHARVAQRLQDDMRAEEGWGRLDAVQKQALSVIADKIARVLTGDPNYDDNWRDIQGYARLVEERLPDSKIGKTTAKAMSGLGPVVDGWTLWGGGLCPVDVKVVVDVEFRNGDGGSGRAGAFNWVHETERPYHDIIKFRLIQAG